MENNRLEELWQSNDWAELRWARKHSTPQQIARHLLDPQWRDRDYDALDELVEMTHAADLSILNEDELETLASSELPELRAAVIRYKGTPAKVLEDMTPVETNSRLLQMLVDSGKLSQHAIDLACWHQPDERLAERMLPHASDHLVEQLSTRPIWVSRRLAAKSDRLEWEQMKHMLAVETHPDVVAALVDTGQFDANEEIRAIYHVITSPNLEDSYTDRLGRKYSAGMSHQAVVEHASRTMLKNTPSLGWILRYPDQDNEDWRTFINMAVEEMADYVATGHGIDMLGFIKDGEGNNQAKRLLAERALLKTPKQGDNVEPRLLLGRLSADIDWWRTMRQRGFNMEKVLWAGSVDGQIAKLRELYGTIKPEDRPEWFTREWIDRTEKEMKGQDEPAPDSQEAGTASTPEASDAADARLDGERETESSDDRRSTGPRTPDIPFGDDTATEGQSKPDPEHRHAETSDATSAEPEEPGPRTNADAPKEVILDGKRYTVHAERMLTVDDGMALLELVNQVADRLSGNENVQTILKETDNAADAAEAGLGQIIDDTTDLVASGNPALEKAAGDEYVTNGEFAQWVYKQLTRADEEDAIQEETSTPDLDVETDETVSEAAAESPAMGATTTEDVETRRADDPQPMTRPAEPTVDMDGTVSEATTTGGPEAEPVAKPAANDTETEHDAEPTEDTGAAPADPETATAKTDAAPTRAERRENINRLLDVLPVTMVTKDGAHQVDADEIMAATDRAEQEKNIDTVEPEPADGQTGTEPSMTPSPGADHLEGFNLRLVDRLSADLDWWRSAHKKGFNVEKDLWAGSVDGQIAKLRELYGTIKPEDRPEWFTREWIDRTEKEMKGQDEPAPDSQEAGTASTPEASDAADARLDGERETESSDDRRSTGPRTPDIPFGDDTATEGQSKPDPEHRHAETSDATSAEPEEPGPRTNADAPKEVILDGKRYTVHAERMLTVDDGMALLELVNQVADRLSGNENVQTILKETDNAADAAEAGLGQIIDDTTDLVASGNPALEKAAGDEYVTNGEFAQWVYKQLTRADEEDAIQEETSTPDLDVETDETVSEAAAESPAMGATTTEDVETRRADDPQPMTRPAEPTVDMDGTVSEATTTGGPEAEPVAKPAANDTETEHDAEPTEDTGAAPADPETATAKTDAAPTRAERRENINRLLDVLPVTMVTKDGAHQVDADEIMAATDRAEQEKNIDTVEPEPADGQTGTEPSMTPSPGADHLEGFNLRLVDRLSADLDWWRSAHKKGFNVEKDLWAGSVDGQIAKLRELYGTIKPEDRPEWFTKEWIDRAEREMKEPAGTASDGQETGTVPATRPADTTETRPAKERDAEESDGRRPTGPQIIFTSLTGGSAMPEGTVDLLDDDAQQQISDILSDTGETTESQADASRERHASDHAEQERKADTAEPEPAAEPAGETTKPFDWNSIEGMSDGTDNIRNWYLGSYPTDDEVGERINPQATFVQAVESLPMDDDHGFYSVIGVRESTVRERVFAELSRRIDCEYDAIYDAWVGHTALDPGLAGTKSARMRHDLDELLGGIPGYEAEADAFADQVEADWMARAIILEADPAVVVDSKRVTQTFGHVMRKSPVYKRLLENKPEDNRRFVQLICDMIHDNRRFSAAQPEEEKKPVESTTPEIEQAEQPGFDMGGTPEKVDSPQKQEENHKENELDNVSNSGASTGTEAPDTEKETIDDDGHVLPVQGNQEDAVPVHGGTHAGTAQGTQEAGHAGDGRLHGPGREGLRPDDHRVRQPLGQDAPAPQEGRRLGSMAQGSQDGAAQRAGGSPQRGNRSALATLDRSLLDPDLQTAGSSLERAKSNIHAIEVLRDLDASGREPANDDIRALAAYAGWGGAQNAFDEDTRNPAWSGINTRLRELLSESEYADARRSTLTAFYTPRPIVDAIWNTLGKAGFGQDRKHPDMVLEPGCGTGNFIRSTPAGTSYGFTGIEVDPISAGIARYLCPDDDIINNRMERTGLPGDAFDLAVGNVPYSDTIRIDGTSIHDWFIRHSLDTVRPGGLVAVLTSRYTLDKNTAKMRGELARRAELVAACRLPRETFAQQAGAEVVSDILILRKRDEPETDATAEWMDAVEFRDGVNANRLFVEHPEYVAGTMITSPGPFGPRIDVTGTGDMDELGTQVGRILTEQLEAYGIDLHDRLGARANEPIVIPDTSAREAMRYTVDDNGHIWYGDMYGQLNAVHSRVRKGGDERMASMLRLRDQAERLLAVERDPDTTDDTVAQGIKDLDTAYDRFVASYGRLNSKENLRVFDPVFSDASLNQLYALEKTGANGFEGKGDMLSKRVVTPTPPMPEHVEEPVEALSISLDRQGEVDLDLIGRLLGTENDAETKERLGDLIVIDPDTGLPVPADEYLSGNVGGKIDHIDELIHDMTEKPEQARVRNWLAENGLSDEAVGLLPDAEECRTELVKSGAWLSATDPIHANVAVLGSDWFSYSIKKHDSQMMSIAGMFFADCKPGVSLLAKDWDAKKPTGNKLFNSIVSKGFVYDGNGPTNSAMRMLYKAVTADPEAIDDKVLATILNNNSLNNTSTRQALWKLTDPELWTMDNRWSQQASCDDYLALARELREHPDVCEYLYATDLERLRHPISTTPYAQWRKLEDAVSMEGLEQWRNRRNEWMEAHPLEPVDANRLQTLRDLRGRLEKTLPARLTHEEITAKLGSAWIPAGVVRDFMVETFKIDGRDDLTNSVMRSLTVNHDEVSGNWQVNADMASKLDEETIREYGIGTGSGRNPFEIVSGALNATTSNLTKPDPNDPEGKRRIRDEQATVLMYQKRHTVEQKFNEWVWTDPDRTRMLEDAYNDRFNRIHPREYDGSYLTFPGLNSDIDLYEHQRNAIARILQSDEGTLVAHVVGAGKTYTGIVACHEAKRLGKASKPMIVVPNHLTEQWAKDYLTLYPDANVLSMTEADGSGKGAARFWAKVAAGDWDAVIVRQETFQRMHVSPERRKQYFDRRAAEMLSSVETANENGNVFAAKKLNTEIDKMGKRLEKTVKQAEKDRTRVDSKLQALRGGATNKEWLDFEDLGVDMLFVDEAHQFKNLAIATTIQVPGADVKAAAKCEDLLDKCELLRDQGKESNIVFATGTPVSNSMAELYNMQRYLAPGLLAAQKVSSFTAWANTFGSIIESVEVKPEGGGYQIKQRFSKFHNLPELMKSFHEYADLLTADKLDLDVPDCEVVPVAVEATAVQKKAVEMLVARGERVRAGVDPHEDNMLDITNDGRKVSLDPKLLDVSDPDIKPMEGGKVQECAEKIHEIWKEHAEDKATQLVFCDTSTPASGKWNIQSDLKRRLVALGIPENEVLFAGQEKNPRKKQALFNQVRKGEVRVLIGSTGTLGTGTNVQDRLIAIHDLDCPWKPAELEQRQGRVRRQGNMFDKVYDYRYVTVGTFDSYMFQTVERKAKFISQVMSSGSPAREAADVDETVLKLADMKAIATGDPHIVERMEAENRLGQLKLLKRAHASQQKDIRFKISTQLQPEVDRLEQEYKDMADDQATFQQADSLHKQNKENGTVGLVIDGMSFTDRKRAIESLWNKAESTTKGTTKGTQTIGEYCGMPIITEAYVRGYAWKGNHQQPIWTHYIGLRGLRNHWAKGPMVPMTTPGDDCLRQLGRVISGGLNPEQTIGAKLGNAKANLESAWSVLSKPWDGQQEYDELTDKIAKMDLAIKHGQAGDEVETEDEAPQREDAPTVQQVQSDGMKKPRNDMGPELDVVDATAMSTVDLPMPDPTAAPTIGNPMGPGMGIGM